MSDISLITLIGGTPTSGIVCSAYKASRFGALPVPYDTAAPGGAADATATSGDAFGGPGQVVLSVPTSEVYWVAIPSGGHIAWVESPSPGLTNPMTTAGDLIVGDTGGTPIRLAKGSDLQVLTVDPITHLLVFATSPSGFANPMTALDDSITGGVAGVPTRLAKGLPGQSWIIDPATGHVAWKTPTGGGYTNPLTGVRGLANTPVQPGSYPNSITQSIIEAGDATHYNAFGWVTSTARGALVAVYRQGTTHESLDGVIRFARSTNGGKTWTVSTIFSPSGGHSYIDPTILCTQTGRLLLSFTEYHDSGSPNYTIDVGIQRTSYSDDDGATWSALTNITQFTSWGISEAAPLQHSSGVILLPAYGENSGDTGERVAVLYSYDDGVTWARAQTYLCAANTNYGETALVERANHSVLAIMRNDTANNVPFHSTVSTDAGLTWSAPAALPFNVQAGRPGLVLFPSSQTLLLFYRRVADNFAAFRYSNDGGTTWSSEKLWLSSVYDYAGGIAIGPNQVAVVVFYETGGGATAAYWTLNVGESYPGLPGVIIGSTDNNNGGGASVGRSTTSTSLVQVDPGTGLDVNFVVPISGSVDVELEGYAYAAAGQTMDWSLFDIGAAAVVAQATQRVLSGTTAAGNPRIRSRHRITGLTPGAIKNYRWYFSSESGASVEIDMGGAPGYATMRVIAN